jgi:hypothetical protein
VRRLFEALDENSIEYAVLRNYEQLPDVGNDLDLVVAAASLDAFARLLADVARAEGWDAVTSCDHWARSSYQAHRIHVFRLYDRTAGICLQIDLFGALLVAGLPLATADELVASSCREDWFNRIDPVIEDVYRLLQIGRLVALDASSERVERYVARFREALAVRGDEIRRVTDRELGAPGRRAISALEAGNLSQLERDVRWAKAMFCMRSLVRRPSHVRAVVARLADRVRIQAVDPCGLSIPIASSDDSSVDALRTALDSLRDGGLVRDWAIDGSRRERRSVLERGGVVVDTQCADPELHVTADTSVAEIRDALLDRLVRRHDAVAPRRNKAPVPA